MASSETVGWEKRSLSSGQPLACQKGNDLVQNGGVGGHVDIMGGGVNEPHAVVGDPRAHALPGVRRPPVLNVALDELPLAAVVGARE